MTWASVMELAMGVAVAVARVAIELDDLGQRRPPLNDDLQVAAALLVRC